MWNTLAECQGKCTGKPTGHLCRDSCALGEKIFSSPRTRRRSMIWVVKLAIKVEGGLFSYESV
jgi:hypothetical protein